jgi:hypothetical protein
MDIKASIKPESELGKCTCFRFTMPKNNAALVTAVVV